MKRFKKLLVTLLVLTFVLSTVSVGFAATTETSPSVVRAKALGILKGDEKGNLNLDKPITRAEAITLIIRISGLESSANLMKGQTKFKDVPATHWATGYINLGVGQGILKGYPDGTFKPNNNVTYAEMKYSLLMSKQKIKIS
ncbi:S-layer homology domain-containing protein [Thermosediminibacter oceani]|uniref:S-layer domain protein n=1 Tax=Thermosediminibacter oceani (strain ATCC BAA-1034 / DSM 16646 / JW/IW-1228P) TaxID=555079 RepID=D9S0M9_THEOJ|nr:S-layer homology domain-containing protein [Thermosediminibacter oceani]ADL08887.1 S-layer domain protein [Thermosediminibacter oceani DSM 16646]